MAMSRKENTLFVTCYFGQIGEIFVQKTTTISNIPLHSWTHLFYLVFYDSEMISKQEVNSCSIERLKENRAGSSFSLLLPLHTSRFLPFVHFLPSLLLFSFPSLRPFSSLPSPVFFPFPVFPCPAPCRSGRLINITTRGGPAPPAPPPPAPGTYFPLILKARKFFHQKEDKWDDLLDGRDLGVLDEAKILGSLAIRLSYLV